MCVSVCVCVLGVRGRGVWVSIRVRDLHKDFPLWLETFCQADRSVYRIGHYARLPCQYETGAMWKTSLRLCWVVRTVCFFFCRSVPVRAVYVPSTWGHPHPRQNLWVWRPPVRKHEWRSLRRWECAGTRSHVPTHTHMCPKIPIHVGIE